MFVNSATLKTALERTYGTAGHLLKIWFALKQMGLSVGAAPVEIDTSNSTPSLRRLFSFGDPDESFFIPFAHTPQYLVMAHDAARSIIQTNIQRWASSGSVVTCDPTEFLEIAKGGDEASSFTQPTLSVWPWNRPVWLCSERRRPSVHSDHVLRSLVW
jgi:5-methylcytosine-specific restriction enzyme B